ncbi:hypothetical protein EBR96_09300 [bacterium]|nr:hypothetical protein [bacterium]
MMYIRKWIASNGWYWSNFDWNKSFDGRDYLSQSIKRKSKIVAIKLGVSAASPWVFKLRRQNFIDGVWKFFGVTREYQTGNAEFDDQIFIISDQPDLWRNFLPSGADKACLNLFNAIPKLTSVTSDGYTIRAEIGRDITMEPTTIAQILGTLEIIVKCMRQAPALSDNTNRMLPWAISAFWIILSIVAFLTAVIGLDIFSQIGLVSLWPPAQDGYIHAIPWSVGTLAACILTIRGTARAGTTILWALLLCAISLPVLTTDYFIYDNIKHDTSAPNQYKAELVDKWTTHGRHANHYHIKLYLPERSQFVEYRISMDDYDHIDAYSHGIATMRGGARGYEWVEHINLNGIQIK